MAVWMGGKSAGQWLRVYVSLGPFPVHPKPSQHCLTAILQHKKVKRQTKINIDIQTISRQSSMVLNFLDGI